MARKGGKFRSHRLDIRPARKSRKTYRMTTMAAPHSPISSMMMAKMKSENAWLRKSRSTELPGILPMPLLEAMAMLACAICAFLSMSNRFGSSSPSVCVLMRLIHVGKRWSPGSSATTFLGSTSAIATTLAPAKRQTPMSLPICTRETRPMNIIKMTTPKSSIAVEKFSGMMSRQMGAETYNIYLKARGSAPSSRCIRDRMSATAVTTASFPNSEGWKPAIQRREPFTSAPKNMVTISSKMEVGTRIIGMALNMRHGTLCNTMTATVPRARLKA